MNSLNSILLEGNLVRDPQGASTPRGQQVCRFAIASNRYFTAGDEKKEEVSFFDVDVWGGEGERCLTELKKGRGVRVVGRLKQDRWEDAEGKVHSRVKIVAEHVEFKPQFNRNPVDIVPEDKAGNVQEDEMVREALLV